ncbi:lipoprotein signal peptidase [Kroppenstedtia pulmonis]|uniref:Lipoprotein signal peptidase n=1 Tax=Kroppenstedtia pulmonis TaxID=1380685 RepID=A0A7D3XQF3_9BACL|nr:signal peptidase II [Kroppenstedtia pulmonis]QKG84747.1 lipoprotein signal peptidase [Kroppenstedtia pulmonis]
MRYYLTAIAVLLLDQVTKWIVLQKMSLYESIPLWDDVFYITSHRNRGAAFGILQEQQWLFIIVTLLVVAGIIIYLTRIGKEQPLMSWSLALILGGAVGNLIDRVRMGEVVDFLDFRLIHYPIFNIADSAIVIGVIIMVYLTLKSPDMDQDERFSKEVGDSR